MSTRACVTDGREFLFIGHDGYPDGAGLAVLVAIAEGAKTLEDIRQALQEQDIRAEPRETEPRDWEWKYWVDGEGRVTIERRSVVYFGKAAEFHESRCTGWPE